MKNLLNNHTSSGFFQIFRLWPIYLSTLIIYILAAGCKKSNQVDHLTPGYDIYMAGTMDGKAVYWKNGIPGILSDSGCAYSITVNGSDIYVCGTVKKGSKRISVYWKNGVETILESQYSSEALGMAIEGNDIYLVGYIAGADNSGNAVYWKNGISNYLSPESKGVARSISVSGKQVYISGDIYGSQSDSAIVWENGKKIFFGEHGSVNAIGFNGTDTFYVGTLLYKPTYWIRDKVTSLYKNGFANALAFSGTDVYFGDGVRPQSDNYAAIWKNDSLTILTDKYTNSSVSGIAVAGTDVYAVGYINDGFVDLSPVYWKNGMLVKLGSNGMVYGITTLQ